MLRRLGLLAASVGAAVTLAIFLAGPAAAAPPSPTDHDCRWTSPCNPGLHNGWDHHRNVGG